MADETNDLVELSQEIRKIIDSNRKFLERVFDEDFEADDEGSAEEFEEL